jgi:uncharacterized Tic20 family protein
MSFILSPVIKILLFLLIVFLFIYSIYKINKLETGFLKLFWIISCVLFFPILPLIYLILNLNKKNDKTAIT